ncbi:MAG: 2-dehydro-3-deoxygalactonokinase [Polaromonas sp.]|uniref:2-dehydro-3-deoxygalactonokinase n=1 Tax=Comamonadaceae TaxID=80864 RepID=UPI00272F4EDE|nr:MULTISPECIES: 2-dehydro-3-deoxygalactonokinase [Comamonadaceae]MDP1741656.1 2-dehydro-3-deoxygalactonokinase [Polaromonas sp.]MDP1943038.1 2-dehydro-3-deoxygalactonokinase [Rhodoferax sp.]MDP3356424.1 2-dehydro-3-deoxygalactonokinase [Polaromonas sp.]MDP3752892.1 2-dehydro-3-deoxygalactonokinase [Polaromonas sp.]
MSARTLLAVDWGTSSLRGAWLDPQGQVIEERAFARGILTVSPGGFAAVFDTCFGDWLRDKNTLCLIAGMAGSKQGWQEAPYCACPAGFDEVASHLAWVQAGRMAIVPGLCCENAGVPDVMRGEETQVLGALQLLDIQDALLVLPGTHSKWVTVQAGKIRSFSTFMTGEFYALLRQHSILARTLPQNDGDLDQDAFDQGVGLALQGGSLLQTAFSVRTLSLFERMTGPALASYLSGLVIGEETRSQSVAPGTRVVLIGSDALTQRYERALMQRKVSVQRVGAEAAWQGLWALAQTIQAD